MTPLISERPVEVVSELEPGYGGRRITKRHAPCTALSEMRRTSIISAVLVLSGLSFTAGVLGCSIHDPLDDIVYPIDGHNTVWYASKSVDAGDAAVTKWVVLYMYLEDGDSTLGLCVRSAPDDKHQQTRYQGSFNGKANQASGYPMGFGVDTSLVGIDDESADTSLLGDPVDLTCTPDAKNEHLDCGDLFFTRDLYFDAGDG